MLEGVVPYCNTVIFHTQKTSIVAHGGGLAVAIVSNLSLIFMLGWDLKTLYCSATKLYFD